MPLCTRICLALIASLAGGSGLAQEPRAYNRIDLNASAESEIGNDLLIAVVYAEAEDNDQSEAANAVNTAISWAAERARSVDGVSLQTGQYTTRPVYTPNSRRISGWIARQSLRLESGNPESLSELLGSLQERVALQSLSYELSKAARNEAEDALIAEAIAAFRRRAELIAAELGENGYRLVQLNVGTSGPVLYRSDVRSLGLVSAAEIAAPEIEAGVQTVSVSVNGTIELRESQ